MSSALSCIVALEIAVAHAMITNEVATRCFSEVIAEQNGPESFDHGKSAVP